MPNYVPSEKEIMRVLTCLKNMRRHPLTAVVEEYNKLYPPSVLFPMERDQRYIKPILDHLVSTKLVSSEVLTFYEDAIPATKFYTLTTLGIQTLHRRR